MANHEGLEEVKSMIKTAGLMKTELVRMDEAMFRKNLLPILINEDNSKYLHYYVGITGSPYKGLVVTRKGKDAYEVPAILDKRFDRSTVSAINDDGLTEENVRIENESKRSFARGQQAEQNMFNGIRGLFKHDIVLDTRERWKVVFKENGIDFYEYFGISKTNELTQTQSDSGSRKHDTDSWDDEEL